MRKYKFYFFILRKDINYIIEKSKGDRISLGSVGKIFPLTKNTYKYYFEGFEDKKNVVNLVVN